jgi:hypothetical protein
VTPFVGIPLINSRGKRLGWALVDLEDAYRVTRHRWTMNSQGWAVGSIDRKPTLMHRYILNCTPGYGHVHHVNENKLDNRRKNIKWFETASEAAAQPHPKAWEIGRLAREEYARRLVERAA